MYHFQREEGDAALPLKTGAQVMTKEEGKVRKMTRKETLPHIL